MRTRYGLVGDGRLARHLHHYFTLLNLPHQRWSRRQSSTSVGEALKDCPIVLLAVSDRAIEPLANELSSAPGAPKTRIHFSGALSTPLAAGFHPLMTFAERLYPLEAYQAVPFIGETGGPAFHEIFPELPNPSYAIDPSRKSLYHALCVMSGNFTSFLWTKIFEAFPRELGLPPEAAIPYLRQVAENLALHPHEPRNAWTGPLVRGDQRTIEQHLEALAQDPYQPIYRAFVQAIAPHPSPDFPNRSEHR